MPKLVDHEQRRAEIAEALLRIAGTRGLHAASMREVATEAGVSLRLVQYYFHTKEELLLNGLTRLVDKLNERMLDRIRKAGLPPTPRSILYAALIALLPTDEESHRVQLTLVAYQALMISDPAFASRNFGTTPDKLEQYLAGQIRLAQEAGEIDADRDPAITATILVALTGGLVSSVVGGQRDGAAAERVLRDHLDRLFAGQPEPSA
ncbi:TetR/AcrR family transcriptional regulator [Crossiella sp. CA-258035]|uniref:TetR/AcrR family transcriptional regulator n=1 Tax=Crossiella sp. CA-258035 TaxID=2981138 RepID=UPI0024BD0C6A|nr:TetR/AcrR family transcriptional regulator [Crossiella sp. CA-258035]WHT15734.1 TetR/AcrR family transcriptional regulator [Crossiella sp. CA-258035]